MTADPAPSLDAIVDRYVDEVLTTDKRATVEAVSVPSTPVPLPSYALSEVLADPRALFTSRRPLDAAGKVRWLVTFALWLGKVPAHQVPADLASRAARFRFLVWSLGPRLGQPLAKGVLPKTVAWPDTNTTVTQEFILAQARAAREDWLSYLNAWEDDPWLAAQQTSGQGRLEPDLRWMTTTWPTERHADTLIPWPRPPQPLALESPRASENARKDDHRRVAADLAERHWLPRGSVLGAAAALFPSRPRLRWLGVATFPALSAVILALFAAGLADAARWAALAVLGLLLLGVAVAPARLDSLALLRIPAAAGAGEAVLLALTSRWWIARHAWLIGAGLLIASALYVMVEARLHGAPRWPALRRGLGITLLGALHAAVLSLVVLGFVTPAMGEHGECLDGWWQASPWLQRPLTPTCTTTLNTQAAAPAGGVLLLMTGWSFAIGLASQVLWSDHPVTAPLGRRRWAKGGRT